MRLLCVALSVVFLALAGCATLDTVQRATEGPTAAEVWHTRFARSYGRVATFDETVAWRDQLDQGVDEYLAKHPEVGTSPRVSQFRFHRRVAVGMSKEEVTLLVGAPENVTSDQATMATAAKQFWPEIKRHAKEMWIYPGGWQFYFDQDRLVDLTVFGRPPIQ